MSRIPHILEPLFDAGTQKINDNWFRYIDDLAPTTGTWTPTLTFATPGDLSIAYSTRVGYSTKIGRLVTLHYQILTSTFTHTTASGECRISGVPFPNTSDVVAIGSLRWQGVTKANYTDLQTRLAPADDTFLTISASGSGQSQVNIAAADMPTAGTINLVGVVQYF